MTKDEILKELKTRTKITGLKLPKHLHLEEQNGVVTLSLETAEGSGSRGVTANMQQDASAFEGWLVCMKAAVPEWNFCLNWDEPNDTANGHYQRFLYRVEKFRSYYGNWVSLAQGCSTQALLIKDNGKYQLNAPSQTGNGRTNDSTLSAENLIENTIIKNQSPQLKNMFKIVRLERQLPVGVFCGKVEKKNAVFAHGKSAVDIWGTSSDNDLVIFELKAPGNEKIGVISELFFYAMVLADEQNGKIIRESKTGEGKAIRASKSLKAMILAQNVHPLITGGVFDLLNAPLKGSIEFGYVEIKPDFVFRRIF